VILLDETASALTYLDVEESERADQRKLKEDYTIIIVTHNMQQRPVCPTNTAFMYMGDMNRVWRYQHPVTNARPEKQTEELQSLALRLISGEYSFMTEIKKPLSHISSKQFNEEVKYPYADLGDGGLVVKTGQ